MALEHDPWGDIAKAITAAGFEIVSNEDALCLPLGMRLIVARKG